jgi:hypothetical protein
MMTFPDRTVSLSGIGFAVLGLAAFGTSKAGPGPSSAGGPVIEFYVAHRHAALTSDYLWAVAFVCFLVFAASLRGHLLATARDDVAPTASLLAAAVTTAGATVYFGLDAALATSPGSLAPPAAQALNVLALNMFLPFAVGALTFGLATGVAIMRSRTLPRWLGWSAVLVGLSFASPLGIFAVVLLLLWSAATGWCAYRRPVPTRAHVSPAQATPRAA